MAIKGKKAKPEELAVEPSVVWPERVDDIPTIYANNLFITHGGGDFYLVFGEVTPPVVVSATQEAKERIGAIEVRPVAKIAVAPDAMIEMARVIQNNVQKYLAPREEGE